MASNKNKRHDNTFTPGKQQPLNQQRWPGVVLAFVIIAVTVIAYLPAISAHFIWDDNELLCDNPMIHASDGLYRFWFTTDAPDYWPLSSTTFWLEWRIWGDNPRPYHVFNIVLHAVSAVLLWRVLKRLKLSEPGAFLAALIFAIHPVAVESVVWISERKTVLSMSFYMFAILAYLRFEDQGHRRQYMFALLAAAGALLAKTSSVMLPVILLLLIWWRHEAVKRQDIIRLTPFFLLSLILGLVTIWFQHQNAIGGQVVRPEGLASRIASVGWVTWFYLYKIVAPLNLAMIYPRWDIPGQDILSFVPLALLMICFIILWLFRRHWSKGALVALGSFVIVLAPVLGLVDMAYARFSLVADHLQYPGLPGVIALIGGGLGATLSWARRKRKGVAEAGFVILVPAIVLILVALTWRQASLYYNEYALWSHTIEVNDRAWNAYSGRARVLAESGNWIQALSDYTKAVEIRPTDAELYINRGNAYATVGEYPRALADYDKAIELDSANAKAYHNRGMTYGRMNQIDQAINDLTRAIELKPNFYEAYCDRGTAYRASRSYDLAIKDYTKAIGLRPNDAQAFNNRGFAYAGAGKHHNAIDDYTQAINLQPEYADSYYKRAVAYYSIGEYDNAWTDVEKCKQLGGQVNPRFIKALTQTSKTSR